MKYIIAIISLLTLGIIACEKKVDPVDTFYVKVDFASTSAKSLTSDVTLNPKDSISLDFTITSAEEMAYVEIQKNGARIDTIRLTGTAKTAYTGSRTYRADSAAGEFSYRVVGRNAQNRFLGDGGKIIKVTIRPDFNFWSYRILQVPDSTAKTNKCYYSVADGQTYSYTDGATKSASIDFGFYWDTTGRTTTSTTDDLKHTIYALNAPQPQLGFYDITSWTKNATLLKKMPTSVNFVSGLTSSGAIQTLIGNNMASGTASKVTTVNATGGSNVIGFKTAAGKFGAILIRYVNGDSPEKTTQIEVDVKVQK